MKSKLSLYLIIFTYAAIELGDWSIMHSCDSFLFSNRSTKLG